MLRGEDHAGHPGLVRSGLRPGRDRPVAADLVRAVLYRYRDTTRQEAAGRRCWWVGEFVGPMARRGGGRLTAR
jgi:hypothetical protein